MASDKKNNFWLKVIEEAKNSINEEVLKATGPILLSKMCEKYKNDVNILPLKYYNPKKDTPEFNDPRVITKHFGTVSWDIK